MELPRPGTRPCASYRSRGDPKTLLALAKHIKSVAKHAAKAKRAQDHYHWRAGPGIGTGEAPELVVMTARSVHERHEDLLFFGAETAEDFRQKNLQFFKSEK